VSPVVAPARALTYHDTLTAMTALTEGRNAWDDDEESGAYVLLYVGLDVFVIPRSTTTPCVRCFLEAFRTVRLAGRHGNGFDVRSTATGPADGSFMDRRVRALLAYLASVHGLANEDDVAWILDGALSRCRRARISPSMRCGCFGAVPEEILAPCAPHGPGAVESDTVRSVDLKEIKVSIGDLVDGVSGVLGGWAHADLELETTAKVSGAFHVASAYWPFMCDWGGHSMRYSTSATIGVLEGLEREAATRPYAARSGTDFSTARASVEGHSFGQDRSLRVPLASVYFDAVPYAHRDALVSSSGCAVGGSAAEATLYGLLELVERDAFLTSWYGGLRLPEIAAGSVQSGATRALLNRMTLCGYTVRFFDATVSIAIPTVIAVSERVDGGPGRLCFGASAHPRAESAIWSALNEVASDIRIIRSHAIERRNDLSAMLNDFDRVRELQDHADLFGLSEARVLAEFLLEPRHPAELIDASTVDRAMDQNPIALPSAAACLSQCVERVLVDVDDVISVDITTPVLHRAGLRAASVIVPDLLPIDFGWQRQRAVTRQRLVERAAAYRDRHSLPASELNLVPHPFP
jgi:ribosomal protein S12 methylthiotransferase accessory factor